MTPEQINILGVNIDCVDFEDTLTLIEEWIESTPQIAHQEIYSSSTGAVGDQKQVATRQICTVNPEFIIDARRDPTFAHVLRDASLRVPDGVGVLWAAQCFGVRLRERVTGSDGIYRISERAAERGWRVFLLGAAPGVAEKTANILRLKYPNLTVVGTYSGSPDDKTWAIIQKHLEEAEPDLLFVAFGHPRQDLWIAQHRLELPVKVAIGVGGAFDFVAGVVPRAPQWIQRLGLEWLYRLSLQPSRTWRMMKLPVFVGLVLAQLCSKPTRNRTLTNVD